MNNELFTGRIGFRHSRRVAGTSNRVGGVLIGLGRLVGRTVSSICRTLGERSYTTLSSSCASIVSWRNSVGILHNRSLRCEGSLVIRSMVYSMGSLHDQRGLSYIRSLNISIFIMFWGISLVHFILIKLRLVDKFVGNHFGILNSFVVNINVEGIRSKGTLLSKYNIF